MHVVVLVSVGDDFMGKCTHKTKLQSTHNESTEEGQWEALRQTKKRMGSITVPNCVPLTPYRWNPQFFESMDGAEAARTLAAAFARDICKQF